MNNNFILLGIISFIFYYHLFKIVLAEGLDKKNFEKKSKNRLCRKDLIIDTKEDCEKAIKNLNLYSSNWWEGSDDKLPPGCGWTDKLSVVGKSMAFWNNSLVGKRRYDIHPVCFMPPKKPTTYATFLKKINKNLTKVNLPEKEEVPIALNMRVGKETDMIKEGMLTGNKLFEQGVRLRSSSKLNSDLNNFREYEGFENRDKFKLLAVNSLLMDLGHLREDQPQGTPIELNLMLGKDK